MSPSSSRYFDKDFISKFEVMRDIATATEKEVILLKDFNFGSDACKRLKLLIQAIEFQAMYY